MPLDRLMGGGDGRKIKRLQQLVGIVNTFEDEIEELTPTARPSTTSSRRPSRWSAKRPSEPSASGTSTSS